MNFIRSLLLIALSVFTPLSTYALDCPPMPVQARTESQIEVKGAVGRLKGLRVGELQGAVKTATKDLMGKLPQADRVYLEQMMLATYCSALRDDKTLSELDKAKKIDAYNREVRRNLNPPRPPVQKKEQSDQQGSRPSSNDIKLSVRGALPLHLWESKPGPNSVKFVNHRFGLIVKLQNETPSSPRVDVAVIDGCVRFDVVAAWKSDVLLENEKLPDPLIFNEELAEISKSTIQRIRISGIIRPDSRDVPSLGIAYVGILFPLPLGRYGAMMVEPRTASTKGKCEAIKKANTQPSVRQLLDFGPSRNAVRSLAPELRDGRLKIHVHVGNKVLEISPGMLGKIKSLLWENWSHLALAQMYEVPEDDYPPIIK